tara:strand:+ start:164 stop:337 length:174 start_codon:yes stop_codon:yes gene_type:complete
MTALESQNKYLMESNDALRGLIKEVRKELSFFISNQRVMSSTEQAIHLSKINNTLKI